ncbi:MAG: helix-turn-helix domain-containing protein [Candidatus Coproplasma sp.]
MSKVNSEIESRVSVAFQKRILEIMEEEEMTKRRFAEYVGVSKDVIIRATLYGIIPCMQTLIKIADVLEVSLDYLLGTTNDKDFDKSLKPASFQERLNALAQEKGEKFSKIAHSMPFPENYFYDWKRQNLLPSLDYLKALATYFNVSIDYLIGRTDFKN